jgi:hypothetical protein
VSSTSRSEGAEGVDGVARGLLEVLERSDATGVDVDVRRRLFAVAVRAYAAGWEPGAEPPFAPGALTTEEVLKTAAEMLRAVDVTSFELAALFDI